MIVVVTDCLFVAKSCLVVDWGCSDLVLLSHCSCYYYYFVLCPSHTGTGIT